MPGPLVAASSAPQIETDAPAQTQSPTPKTLLDSLLGTHIIRLTDHEMSTVELVPVFLGLAVQPRIRCVRASFQRFGADFTTKIT